MFHIRKNLNLKNCFRYHHIYIDHYNIKSTGISLNEFRQRRSSLVNLIRNYLQNEENQVSKQFLICLSSAKRSFMGPDVAYFPFKQQSDFYYLTGCMQSDSILLIRANDQTFSTHLYLTPMTMNSIDNYERWFGPTITDHEKICQIFDIDHVHSIDELKNEHFSSSIIFHNLQTMKNKISFLKKQSKFSNQLIKFLHLLRSIKSPTEQNLIRHSCQLISKGFLQTMRFSQKPHINNEYLIKARLQYECEILDDTTMAFYPVVAANGRSNIIHYQKNNQNINHNDVIMLDGGCLYKQYASDITRFWPINGRFTSIQKQLYEILLTVQKNLIEHLKTDNKTITRSKLNLLADEYMIKYLREEFILSRTLNENQAKLIINNLCPTSVTHHLGLDVHDCEELPFSELLQSGNVITIEPGLYIPFDCTDVPPDYRGFSTRLEDDVLITENGCEILTNMCPKEVDDLYRILDDKNKFHS